MVKLKEFKNWLVLSGITNDSYVYWLTRFFKELGEQEFSKENIDKILLKIKEKNSICTLNFYIKAIRKYIDFKKLPVEKPNILKEIQRLPEHFTLWELENNIIPMVEVVLPRQSLKVTALFYFMFFTGLRKSDILDLERKDIDLEKRMVKVYEHKIKRERMVRFPERVQKLLKAYFECETEDKNAFNLADISLDYICLKLKPYIKDKVFHPHMFRHSFAVHCLKSGLNLMPVSLLLGHKNINTTMRYLGLTQDEMNNLYDEKIK